MIHENLNDSLVNAVRKAYQSEIEKIIKEEALEAEKRVGERVRGMAGDIAARILTRFNMEMRGSQMIITVDTTALDRLQTKP